MKRWIEPPSAPPAEDEQPLPALPSKSQRKREATALQDIGERLVELTAAQLRHIPLPADLLAAVQTAQAIAQRGGRKRQLQYIGKLMRQLSAEEELALRTALQSLWPNGRT